VLEAVDQAHQPEIPAHPGLTVHWLHRHGEPAGRSDRLVDAVRQLTADRPPDVAFGAAEANQISDVRTYLRTEHGLPPARSFLTGYWRLEPGPGSSRKRPDR
jgi:NADPH-dependent ferric siderophore reductase